MNQHIPEDLINEIIMYSIPKYDYLWELKYLFLLKQFAFNANKMHLNKQKILKK